MAGPLESSTDSSLPETLREIWKVHPSLPCPHEWHRTNLDLIEYLLSGDPQDFISYVTRF